MRLSTPIDVSTTAFGCTWSRFHKHSTPACSGECRINGGRSLFDTPGLQNNHACSHTRYLPFMTKLHQHSVLEDWFHNDQSGGSWPKTASSASAMRGSRTMRSCSSQSPCAASARTGAGAKSRSRSLGHLVGSPHTSTSSNQTSGRNHFRFGGCLRRCSMSSARLDPASAYISAAYMAYPLPLTCRSEKVS